MGIGCFCASAVHELSCFRHNDNEASQPPYVKEILRKLEIAHDALDEITFYGLSRPREMGEGDNGDGHYKRIAQNLIAIAANGRRKMR